MIDIINDILIKRTSADLIILFGSAAKDRLRSDSDIDIAFLSDKEFTDYDVFIIAQEMAVELKRDVDLIDLKKASTVFKAQIVGTGKVIYFSDPNIKIEFQMKVFKEYCLLNEERKPILDKILERGSVYA